MLRRLAVLACAGSIGASLLLADFTYEQTATMTGGAMMGMMKLAGAFSKQAREPIKTTHIVKGDKMATISAQRISISDLSAETITEIDTQKKQYSVVTFAEMKQMLDEASQKLKGNEAQTNLKVTADATGATRKINGYDAKQMIIKLEIEAKDPESGKAGGMNVVTDSWFASGISGYNEVRDFQKRMAEKLAWTPGGGGLMAGRSDISKGMAAAAKEMAKVDGIPILQMIKMGGAMGNMTPEQQQQMAQAQQQQEQAQQQQQPQRQQAQPSVGGALGGALGGRLGRFGGLGRKKEPPKEEPQPQPQAQAQPQAQTAPPAGAGAGSLMEMTVEMTSFSAGPADASKFEIPSGFKKVAPEKRR